MSTKAFLETDDENLVGLQQGQDDEDQPESDEKDLAKTLWDKARQMFDF